MDIAVNDALSKLKTKLDLITECDCTYCKPFKHSFFVEIKQNTFRQCELIIQGDWVSVNTLKSRKNCGCIFLKDIIPFFKECKLDTEENLSLLLTTRIKQQIDPEIVSHLEKGINKNNLLCMKNLALYYHSIGIIICNKDLLNKSARLMSDYYMMTRDITALNFINESEPWEKIYNREMVTTLSKKIFELEDKIEELRYLPIVGNPPFDKAAEHFKKMSESL